MPALDALAIPARLRVLRALNERERADLNEIAAAAAVHPNTARSHLRALEHEGIVEHSPAHPGGRGRPLVLYRLRDGWALEPGLRGIAELLGAVLEASNPSQAELRALGSKWGHALQAQPAGERPAGEEVARTLAHLGFDARVEGDQLHLGACPCPIVSPNSPELVCTLVDAVAQGVLDGAGSSLRLTRVEHDPHRRECSATLTARR
jgi:predicted ArsR family transcriptional regulator